MKLAFPPVLCLARLSRRTTASLASSLSILDAYNLPPGSGGAIATQAAATAFAGPAFAVRLFSSLAEAHQHSQKRLANIHSSFLTRCRDVSAISCLAPASSCRSRIDGCWSSNLTDSSMCSRDPSFLIVWFTLHEFCQLCRDASLPERSSRCEGAKEARAQRCKGGGRLTRL